MGEVMEHCDCSFPHPRGFIQSSRFAGSGDSGRDHVSICMDCGKIHVVGDRNGQHFHISFHICMPDHLAVVGKYAALLEGDAEAGWEIVEAPICSMGHDTKG
jgi:hypothetical protein